MATYLTIICINSKIQENNTGLNMKKHIPNHITGIIHFNNKKNEIIISIKTFFYI